MVIVVLSAVLVLLWGSGGLLVDLLFPRATKRGFLAFAAGLSLLHLLTLTGIPLKLVLGALAIATAARAILLVGRGWRPKLPVGRTTRLILAGLLLACLPLWTYFLIRPLWGFDARNLWFFQARIMFMNGSFPFAAWSDVVCHPGPIFAICPHAEYPKLLPALAASVATIFGFWNEYLPKLSLIVLQIVELIALIELGWRIRAILLMAAITVVPRYRFFFDSASLDIHIGFLTLAAILAFGRDAAAPDGHAPQGGEDDRLIGIAALALLAQLKVEGQVIVLVVLASYVVSQAAAWIRLRRVWRAALLFTPAVLWIAQARALSIRSYFEQDGTLAIALQRLRAEYFQDLLPGIVTQAPVVTGAACFVLAAVARRWFVSPRLGFAALVRDPCVSLGLVAAAGLFVAQSVAYLISPFQSAHEHLVSTAYRTTMSMEAALIGAAANLLGLRRDLQA